MTKITILQVLPALGIGGVEEGTVAVSDALIKAGHRSIVASAGGPKVATITAGGAVHYQLALNKKSPLHFFALVRHLSDIIKNEGVDIVHARSRWPAWCAYIAAKRCGVPFMTTFHGHHKVGNPIKRYYNSIMVRTRHTIAVSQFIADYIHETYTATLQACRTKIHVIPRGIDIQRFDPSIIAREDIKQLRVQWNLTDSLPVILLPARLTRIKGHKVFLEALKRIEGHQWQAVILGAPEIKTRYQSELEQQIQDLGLQLKVTIQPAMANMPLAYAASDIVVCANTQAEAFGRVIVEAQAMGKPIIASRLGEPKSIIDEGKTGWLFESGNSEELAEKLLHVMDLNDEEGIGYSLMARDSVLKDYTTELMCKRTMGVYQEVLQDK